MDLARSYILFDDNNNNNNNNKTNLPTSGFCRYTRPQSKTERKRKDETINCLISECNKLAKKTIRLDTTG